jgi:hypothetical protein
MIQDYVDNQCNELGIWGENIAKNNSTKRFMWWM